MFHSKAANRHEPDEQECRTKMMTPEFSRCLMNDLGCVHSVEYFDGCFCLHGRHLEFSLKDPALARGQEQGKEQGTLPRLMDYFSSVAIL